MDARVPGLAARGGSVVLARGTRPRSASSSQRRFEAVAVAAVRRLTDFDQPPAVIIPPGPSNQYRGPERRFEQFGDRIGSDDGLDRVIGANRSTAVSG